MKSKKRTSSPETPKFSQKKKETILKKRGHKEITEHPTCDATSDSNSINMPKKK